jgi:hypothetical protein
MKEADTEFIEKFVVESTQSQRGVDGEREFLVYWEILYGNDEASWEPEDPLADHVSNAIREYWNLAACHLIKVYGYTVATVQVHSVNLIHNCSPRYPYKV